MATTTSSVQNSETGLQHSTLSVVSGLLLAAAVGSAALLFSPVSLSSTPTQHRGASLQSGTADDSLHMPSAFAVTGETDLSYMGSSSQSPAAGATQLGQSSQAEPHVEDAMNPSGLSVAAYE